MVNYMDYSEKMEEIHARPREETRRHLLVHYGGSRFLVVGLLRFEYGALRAGWNVTFTASPQLTDELRALLDSDPNKGEYIAMCNRLVQSAYKQRPELFRGRVYA